MKLYSLKPIFWSWKRRGRIRLIVQWKEDCIPSHTSDEIERNFHPEPNRRDRILCPSDSRSSQCLICFRSLFKRRRLILANLNIVLEEYLSVVIFDISHSKFVFDYVVCFAFYFTSTLPCLFMLPYVQWFNFRVLLTWARLLEFNFLTPKAKSGFDQKTPRCTKLPLEMAHRI